MNDAIKMQISAFVDGELPDNEAELLLRRMSQDPGLRHQAAEYYAIGRTIRGERVVPGLAKLRDRVRAALDEEPVPTEPELAEPAKRNYMRPAGGLAIAATVALAAIFGLQQFEQAAESPVVAPAAVAVDSPATAGYTVPAVYHELHREGASNINARLATLRMLEDEIDELDQQAPMSEDQESAGEAAGSGAP